MCDQVMFEIKGMQISNPEQLVAVNIFLERKASDRPKATNFPCSWLLKVNAKMPKIRHTGQELCK